MKTILDCQSCERNSDTCDFACLNSAAAPVPDSALASSGVAAPIPASIIPFLSLPEGFDPVNSYLDFIELMHLVHVRKIPYHKVAVILFQGNPLFDMPVHQIVSAVYAAVNKEQSK